MTVQTIEKKQDAATVGTNAKSRVEVLDMLRGAAMIFVMAVPFTAMAEGEPDVPGEGQSEPAEGGEGLFQDLQNLRTE